MKLRLLFTAAFLAVFASVSGQVTAQETAQDASKEPTEQKTLEVYGFVMADMGYNFNQINPNWFDALRVTRLPTYKDQFAPDGQVFFGVRQTRFGVKGYTQTPVGELKTKFEFDLFGVGPDEGQTTMRLRHAYAEIGRFLVGQTNSVFMDNDVFPNIVEYWGPTGMVFYRNVQIRYAPVMGTNEVHISLERPGASADKGSFESRIELDSVKGQQQLPDVALHYKRSGKFGHVQLAGMLRPLKWKDIHTSGGYDLSGSVMGWGLHFSTALNLGKKDVFRGSVVYGAGIENYMNDAPTDVGVELNANDPQKPITGKALTLTGIMAYLEHTWNKKWGTVIGYSATTITNTDYASPTAYKAGQYATLTIISTPFTNAMIAGELQYGKRQSVNDFSSEAVKIQFSFRYDFAAAFYKKTE